MTTTVTFASPHHFERGQYIVTAGKTCRIVGVPSATSIVVDRPWWLPLHAAWVHGQRPFVWLGARLSDLWYRFRYGWDD